MKQNRIFFKKMLSILLPFILCAEMTLTVLASEPPSELSEEEKASLVEVIGDIECQKEILGLTGIDFSELCIGAPVQTYVYRNSTFEEGMRMYPITFDNQLIFWAINQDGKFQVTTALTSEVNDKIDVDTPFSIVFDKNSSYLYVGDSLIFLRESDIEDVTRSVIASDFAAWDALQDADLLTATLSSGSVLGYTGLTGRASNYYGCNVRFVSQNPPSSLCWSATIACIVNYKKGTALSAVSVAQGYYSSGDYDKPLSISYASSILSKYGLSYSYRNVGVTSDVILTNLMNDYPIYSSWSYSAGSHAVCIYGVNPVSGYLYIMDPEFGFTSAPLSGGTYTYVSNYSGTTLQLHRAVCHSW